MSEVIPEFLDVPTLLEQSQPQPQSGWLRIAGIAFVMLVLGSMIGGQGSPGLQQGLSLLGSLAMIVVIIGLGIVTWQAVQRQRQEQQQIESIEELIQLRRWPQAAAILNAMLSVPSRSPQGRVQALIFLSSVLARYHRFHDAITVQEHLLETVEVDAGVEYALKLGRAMAMLHEDRLIDVDRALSELRKLAGDNKSAGLVLIEIYRDVKTGHAEEAIELFEKYFVTLRDQLGHRVADAWALVAKAYQMLEKMDDARAAYANATLLAPAAELERRYPEVATLAAMKGA